MIKRIKEYWRIKDLNEQFNNNISVLDQMVLKYVDNCGYIERRNELEGDVTSYTQTRRAVFTEEQLKSLEGWGIDVPVLACNSVLSDIGQSIVKEINQALRNNKTNDILGSTSKNTSAQFDIVQIMDAVPDKKMLGDEMYLIGNSHIGSLLQPVTFSTENQKLTNDFDSTYGIGYVNFKKSEEESIPMHIYVDPYLSYNNLTFSIISEKVLLYTPKNIIKSIELHKEDNMYILNIEYTYTGMIPNNVCNINLHLNEVGEL